jgi:lipopolysaccharide exporter
MTSSHAARSQRKRHPWLSGDRLLRLPSQPRIGCAIEGFGVYSLAFGQLAMACTTTVCAAAIGWHDGRPTFHFRTHDIRPYLRFGLFQLGNRGVNFLVCRADQVIVGTTLGASTLGLYNLAWNLAVMPATKINPILTRVFSKVQLDNERLKRGYLTLLWLLATTNGPILVGGAVVAGSLIPLVFGAQWAAMVPLFQILAFGGLSRSIVNPVGALVLAKGQPDLEFKLNVWFLILQIPANPDSDRCIFLHRHHRGAAPGQADPVAGQSHRDKVVSD